ncbi:MAG: ChbG/HpnK family deacetylase [Hyphomicrobiaceae bacterium]
MSGGGQDRRRLIVCADDYGFTPGVSRGIRELLAAGRISATSVMTNSEFWPEEAAALRAVARSADIGLHVTLTDQRSIGAMPTFAPTGRFPPMAAVYRAGLRRQLPLAEIEAEIERQVACFIALYGVPPAHIDGHHHIHQLPGVREAVIAVAARVGSGKTWVRCCSVQPTLALRRGVGAAKAMVIGALGRGLRRLAQTAGVPVNAGFSGAYDFLSETRATGALFERFLLGSGTNSLVMCHPGYADAELAQRDIMTTPREAELRYLMSDAWLELLARSGLEVGPFLRRA